MVAGELALERRDQRSDPFRISGRVRCATERYGEAAFRSARPVSVLPGGVQLLELDLPVKVRALAVLSGQHSPLPSREITHRAHHAGPGLGAVVGGPVEVRAAV